jgi:hypothetical protein
MTRKAGIWGDVQPNNTMTADVVLQWTTVAGRGWWWWWWCLDRRVGSQSKVGRFTYTVLAVNLIPTLFLLLRVLARDASSFAIYFTTLTVLLEIHRAQTDRWFLLGMRYMRMRKIS